jgi:hypothetical protein
LCGNGLDLPSAGVVWPRLSDQSGDLFGHSSVAH